jgi:predicted membrane metal-binding protein
MVSARALALVAVVMLLYSPYYLLYDIGFVFSFSAVLGLAKS